MARSLDSSPPVQAERLRERREQLYAVIREHGDPCIVCENSIKDFADEALALLAGQAEQIERLTRERDEASREIEHWETWNFEVEQPAYLQLMYARDALRGQRDNLRDALAAIAMNAEGWHGPIPEGENDPGAGQCRALAVIARWARNPASIPAGVVAAAKDEDLGEREALRAAAVGEGATDAH